MARRNRPIVISTRVRVYERALIRAVAESEGVTVSEAVHRLLMPAVQERLSSVMDRFSVSQTGGVQ